MQIEHIYHGDFLKSTDSRGTAYYKVLRCNRVTVDVLCENGNRARIRAVIFDGKVSYIPDAFKPRASTAPAR